MAEVTWHIYVCNCHMVDSAEKWPNREVLKFFCVFGVVPELETTLETQNSGFLLSRVAIA